jgi:hypothetical protein
VLCCPPPWLPRPPRPTQRHLVPDSGMLTGPAGENSSRSALTPGTSAITPANMSGRSVSARPTVRLRFTRQLVCQVDCRLVVMVRGIGSREPGNECVDHQHMEADDNEEHDRAARQLRSPYRRRILRLEERPSLSPCPCHRPLLSTRTCDTSLQGQSIPQLPRRRTKPYSPERDPVLHGRARPGGTTMRACGSI